MTTNENFSLDRVRNLVAAMEQELASAPADRPDVLVLRDEIAHLKQLLASDDQHGEVKEKLHTVRGTLQDMTARVESEVLKDSRYIAEIGRILGLV
ncbi:hypothetical protein [Noviherbaspirillum denitrificans]|uniref:Uncharacterized protein n=1 Tax=Noviherbaspirillum denitrificans TaxID=1968433 RepID=A0A254T7K2_9BURK|nr:hypothetical protein [Noviherbaspirillum denitrificans]OWW18631.1 hypothetical protein AYR66_03315 [Noviherbaspirillum denitrificans]